MAISALEKIKAIREKAEKEVEAIKAEAVSEVVKRISEAKEVLRSLEAEYTELTGKTVRGERVSRGKATGGVAGVKADFRSEKELEDLLKGFDGHRATRKVINDKGYNLRSAMNVAKSNPKKFGYQQKGPQGEVWLK
jgi:hypothetical protein